MKLGPAAPWPRVIFLGNDDIEYTDVRCRTSHSWVQVFWHLRCCVMMLRVLPDACTGHHQR